MKIKISYILFILLFSFCRNVPSQEIVESLSLKSEINKLKSKQDIIGINRIISSNSSLAPEYALKTLTENLKKSKEAKDPEQTAHTLNALGNFWLLQSDKIKSYDYYLQAKSVSDATKDSKFAGNIVLNLANVTQDREEQIDLYHKAIQIFKRTDDEENLSKAYLNLGNIYVSEYWAASSDTLSQKDLLPYYKKEAVNALNKVAELNGKKQNSVTAVVNIYYGQLYKYEGNFPKAELYFQRAEKLSSELNNIKTLTYCKLHLADLAMEENENEKALAYLRIAEQFSEKYSYNEYLAGIYELYIQLYSNQKNYQKALEYSKKHNESTVKLNDLISRDKIHALNLQYSLAENEHKIEKYEEQSKFNRAMMIVLIFIAILVTGISYLIVQNKKRKIESVEKTKQISDLEKSAIEIKLKNQMLEDELLKEKIIYSQNHLMNFANLSNRIQFFLDELKSRVRSLPNGQETQEEVNSLKMKFSEILHDRNQFNQLNSLSSQLNQDFFFHVRQNYANISNEDEKLLSFIILNMSSKEISSSLNISASSVYKKRYRLRKKLKLENEESFEDFYQKIISSLN